VGRRWRRAGEHRASISTGLSDDDGGAERARSNSGELVAITRGGGRRGRGHADAMSAQGSGPCRARVRRPQATNAASPPSVRTKGTFIHSPRETWNSAASTITTTRQQAARGVSLGLIRVQAGSTSPIAPASSDTPMNRTSGSGTSGAQGIIGAIDAMGWVAFRKPAFKNNAASRI
jgi:hypothetical protein